MKKYHKIMVGLFGLALLLAVFLRFVRSRRYVSDLGINLVVAGDESMSIVGVSVLDDSLVWVGLPNNLKIEVSEGKGSYPALSVWNLGEIDGSGEKLVIKSLGESLGLWIHAAVRVEGKASLDNLMDRLLDIKKIAGLGWLDRYLLYKDISNLTAKGIVLETTLPSQVVSETSDPDGYKWLEPNKAVFVWSKDLWPKEEVVNLSLGVEVVNLSDVQGLARKRARQLESVGFRVIRVTNGEMAGGKLCVAKIKPDITNKMDTLRKVIKNYLNCEVEMVETSDDFFGDVAFYVAD